MKKGIFLSGTSTEIGKTVVSSILCKILTDSNIKTAYYKPVQTGAVFVNNNLVSTDCRFVERVAGELCSTHTSYLFKKPASPHFASRLEKKEISLNKIISDYNNIKEKNDIIITEGAGGLYVPLNDDGDLIVDIAAKLKLNMILAAPAGLGTINHVSLSYIFAKQKKIKISSVLLLYYKEEPTDIEIENRKVLKKILNIDSIYLIPAVKNVDTEKNIIGNIFESLDKFPDSETIKRWIYE